MCNNYLKRKLVRSLILLVLLSGARMGFAQTPSVASTSSDSTQTGKVGSLERTAKADSVLNAGKIYLLNKTQQKSNLLQSTATVYTDQLTTTPAPSFLQALPGRLSGLYTRQRSGVQDTDDPTSVIDFRIRGQNPLILVDGVPRDFTSIEPESIESITVLKDALSTVMYGQRSSNNMILVTTKRPVISPFKLSATYQRGSEHLINLPKPVSAADYAILYNEALNNDGQAPAYSAADIIAYRNGTDPYGHPNNNWQNLFLNKSADISRFNVNIQSGNQTARFYVALDYQNEGGFLKTSDLNSYDTNNNIDRYIIRSNVSIDLNKTLKVDMNIFGRIQDAIQPGGTSSAIFTALGATPANAYPIFNKDGSLGGTSTFNNNISGLINNSGYLKGSSKDLSADITITQKLDNILSGLWIKGDVSYNNTVNQTVDRTKEFAVYNNTPLGSAIYQQIGTNVAQRSTFAFDTRRTYTYGKLSLGYDKKFGNNSISALLLADRQSTTLDLTLPAIYINYASSVSYNYAEKYFAEAAASYGGFNRYKPGNRFGMFYAGGLGWNLAKEDFLSGQTWLNSLKPRINYGRTGNTNVGYYVYDQYYDAEGTVYYFGATGSGTASKGYSELALANSGVTWEKADKLNVGLDIAMLANHLNITSEYFNDTYFDLMQTRGTSSQLIGQEFPLENIGRNRYTGFENSVAWNGKAGRVNYFVSGNASVLNSKVLYQDEVIRQYDYQRRTGLPVSQTFGYIAEGFFESQDEINNSPVITGKTSVPGDLRYKDLNDDGVIDDFDETAIGTQKPLIYYGITAGFNVGGFDMSVSLQGVANNDINLAEAGALEYEFQNSGNGQAFEHHLNRWTPDNAANATYPRLSIGANANNQRNSTFWIRSGDYLRLQNVDLGYTLPASITRKLKVNRIRIFANGFNLYSFDGLNHTDPENNNSVYPLRRTFNAGLNIKL